MDTFEAIATKLDIREFSPKSVSAEIKKKVLEAARLTASGINSQHWRFILVDGSTELRKLAMDSTSGQWVAGANFAIIILTNPKYNFHLFDAGRAVQDMQLAAWNYGIVSRVYTGVNKEGMAKDFGVPSWMNISAVLGFGHPVRKIIGRKNRKPLEELAFSGRFGQKLRV